MRGKTENQRLIHLFLASSVLSSRRVIGSCGIEYSLQTCHTWRHTRHLSTLCGKKTFFRLLNHQLVVCCKSPFWHDMGKTSSSGSEKEGGRRWFIRPSLKHTRRWRRRKKDGKAKRISSLMISTFYCSIQTIGRKRGRKTKNNYFWFN